MPLTKRGRILVTGGAGFIGSALVWALNEKGFEDIVVADRLGTDEKWRNLAPLRFADYVDADALIAGVEKHDGFLGDLSTVFHMGACASTTETDAGFLMRNNFDYTRRLCAWARRAGARFFYASSAATYGDGSRGMADTDPAIDKLRPLNMYGYSKHLFDCYARRQGFLGAVVGLKFFNVYGPNEDHKGDMRSLVHKAYGQIVETGMVRLFRSHHPDYRDGEQRRDFLYVKDAVAMILHLANRPLAGGLFNIGSGVASTWLQLAVAIFGALGRQPSIEFIDMPESLRGKYQYHTCAEITKLAATRYPQPITPLQDAVADYVQNYLVSGRRLGD